MKVGSIVVVIRPVDTAGNPDVRWLPVGDNKTLYVVRELVDFHGTPEVLLEEGVIGFNPNGSEISLKLHIVKEVQPPEEVSIENLMEEVNSRELFKV
jgi:hypothetical protein